MKKLILTICMSLVLVNVYSQEANNIITIQKKKFYQNGEQLKPKELKTILTNNPASAAEYNLAKQNMNVATPLLLAGSVCCFAAGYSSFSQSKKELDALNNGQFTEGSSSGLGFAVAGLACVVVAVPFSVKAKKHLNKSVDQYNSNISPSGQMPAEFEFMVSGDGLGVRMRF